MDGINNKVELLTLEELISSPQALYLLFILVVMVFVIRWFINEANGNNYYRKYPVAKSMDNMAKNGELKSLTSDDINSAIMSIDHTSAKEEQALQFEEYLRSKKLPAETE
jgi:uncharacterized ion transporter superfamily protein YfcC